MNSASPRCSTTRSTRSSAAATASPREFRNLVTGEIIERTADQIVVEHGTRPADQLYLELRSESRNDGVTDIEALLAGRPHTWFAKASSGFELYRIGDAVASRNIAAAVLDAIRLCSAL
jgi:hypothetical protein